MNQRNLGIMLGGAGLAAGAAAVATDSGVLGLLAGGLAAGAGIAALASKEQQPADTGPAVAELARRTEELEQSRAEASLLREANEHHKQSLAAAEARVAELTAQLAAAQSDAPRPDTPEIESANGDAADEAGRLIDRETGLFTEAYFHVALESRIASARRHLRPVAIALLDVVEGAGTETGGRADSAIITTSIQDTLRDSDTASRLGDGVFGLILEDTPENGAVWTVERVRRNIVSRHGNHTMWAGVACYPAHAFSPEDLLEQARAALKAAREWQQDRIEVAIAEGG